MGEYLDDAETDRRIAEHWQIRKESFNRGIDACIALYKSRKPYDQQTVEAFEKLKGETK